MGRFLFLLVVGFCFPVALTPIRPCQRKVTGFAIAPDQRHAALSLWLAPPHHRHRDWKRRVSRRGSNSQKLTGLVALSIGQRLFLQLDVQTVRLILPNVFHGVCLGIVPDDLAGLGRDGVRFAVGQRGLHGPTG